MNWVRCVRCRTVGNRDRSGACVGCGAAFPEAAPDVPPSAAAKEAEADLASNRLRAILIALAVAGLLVILAGPKGELPCFAAILEFFLVVVLILHSFLRKIYRANFHVLISFFLGVAALAAALAGAYLLVGLACAGMSMFV